MNRDKTLSEDNVKQETEATFGRRSLIGWFWKLAGLVALLELGWIARSILRSKQGTGAGGGEELVDAGMVADFTAGTVTPIPQGQFHLACLADGSFLALSKSCTHLGCSVPWDEERGKFICPCHGSTFDIAGSVLTPPALRPLDYYPVRIENGLVRVDISQPIRRESFLPDQVSQV